jgi:hypothetical protein
MCTTTQLFLGVTWNLLNQILQGQGDYIRQGFGKQQTGRPNCSTELSHEVPDKQAPLSPTAKFSQPDPSTKVCTLGTRYESQTI